MHKKLILFLIIVILAFPTIVLADCNSCNASNCSSCGCVSKNGKCVYYNYEKSVTSCGNNMIENIPTIFPKVTSIIYNILLVSVPILLVILGMIDLLKAMSSGKEDDIKKNQSMIIKRIFMGIGVFGVFIIVRIVVSLAAGNGSVEGTKRVNNIMKCAECFITNHCG